MFSPPTRKATTPCSSHRRDMKRKTPNTPRRIIRWMGEGRVKDDVPVDGAMRQTDSRPKTERERTTQEIHMRTKRKTPNIERRTSNAERKVPPFGVNEANSEYAAPKKIKYDLEDRLLEFAVAVAELTDDLPNTRAGNDIAGQLLRCGTSPYGHHGEVESAESRCSTLCFFTSRFSSLSVGRWALEVGRFPLFPSISHTFAARLFTSFGPGTHFPTTTS